MGVIGFGRQLTWDDFRKIDKKNKRKYSAQVKPEIKIKWESTPDGPGAWRMKNVAVELSLVNSETWVIEGDESDELLAHEQRHYDIAVIAAREMEQKLAALTGKGSAQMGAQKAVRKVVSAISAKLKRVQIRYDEDAECGTDHGVKANLQARWDHRINKSLVDDTASVSQLDVCPRDTDENVDAGAAAGAGE